MPQLRILDMKRKQDLVLHSVRVDTSGFLLLAWAGAAPLLAYRVPHADRPGCTAIEVVCTLTSAVRHHACFSAGADVQCSMSHRGSLACMTASALQVALGERRGPAA